MTDARTITHPGVETLLRGVLDYAGLFPPARCPLPRVQANFVRYSGEPEAWLLGKLVVPFDQVLELERGLAAAGNVPQRCELSVLVGAAEPEQAEALAGLQKQLKHCRVVTVEAKWPTSSGADQVAEAFVRQLPSGVVPYLEIPWQEVFEPRIARLAAWGACAKLRTGGITAEAFPGIEAVTDFLAACAQRGVAMKATAGLHHTWRGLYPLTYETDSPRAVMHGFLNVILASVCLATQPTALSDARQLLSLENGRGLSWRDTGLAWRDRFWTFEQLDHARSSLFHSFGSCSFDEPVYGLREMGWR